MPRPTSQQTDGNRDTTPRVHALVVVVLLVAPVLLLSRSLFTSKVLLPSDMLLLMEPWGSEARREFADFWRPQNPMLDPIQQQLPWRTHAAREIREGTVPLWNPYMFAGTAFVANLQSSIYYPPNALFYVMPVQHAFEWVALVHLWLAALFTYAFLRALGLREVPSAAGALGFSMCGFVVVWLCYVTPVATIVWLPCCLWLMERLTQRRRALDMALLAGAVAMVFLAGHAQISIYVMAALVAYAAFRFAQIWRGEGRRALGRCAGLGASAVTLGLVLAMPQILPTLEFSRINYRSGEIAYDALIPIKPAQLSTLLIPDAFGNPADYTDAVGQNMGLGTNHYIEGAGYASCVLVALAAFGLALSRHPARWFFAGAAAVAILIAIGSPINRLTYHLVPVMKQLPNLGRALCMVCLAVPVLGAMGLQALGDGIDEPGRRRAKWVGVGTAALFVAVGLKCWLPIALDMSEYGYPRSVLAAVGEQEAITESILRAPRTAAGPDPSVAEEPLRRMRLEFLTFAGLTTAALAMVGLMATRKLRRRAGGLVLVGLVAVDMLAFGSRFHPACDPAIADARPPTLEKLADVGEPGRILALGPARGREEDTLHRLSPNVGMAYGLEEIRGSESLYAKRYDNVLRYLSLSPPYDALTDSRRKLLDVLNVRHVVTTHPMDRVSDMRRVLGSTMAYENASCMPRAFVVPEAVPVADQQAAFSWLRRAGSDPARVVPVEGLDRTTTQGGGGRVVSVASRTNGTRVRVDGDGGWLVLSQAVFPGWHACVDGRDAPLFPAYGAVWTTPVAAGPHVVDFVFLPATSVVGQFLGLLACAVLAAVFAHAWVGKRRGCDGGA